MIRSDVPPLVATAVARDLRRGRAEGWLNTALRTRSRELYDIFAAATAPGRSAAELAIGFSSDEQIDLAGGDEADMSAAALATVWATTAQDSTTLTAAHRLLRRLLERTRLPPAQQQIFAQVAYLLGHVPDVEWALATFPENAAPVRQALRTDLLNPVHGNSDAGRWQQSLSEPFVAAGLPPITVETGHPTAFDGLRSTRSDDIDGPLVTVIMPCYRPDAALLTSVRSILDQTYRNLEILLVDDASGPDYTELFTRSADLDPRVEVVRLDTNGGTYVARNAGLRRATGEFITVQDADDWSHPSRLAEQVRLLVADPDRSGSRSDAIRATDDLTHQWVGYSPRRRNASSLMFRRAALERIGPFDAVRKGADSEFHERLTILAGPVADTKTPLAVTRLRQGTLSRGDFSYRWMSPDRRLYRASYRSWHRELRRDRSVRPSPVGDVENRPFPAPPSFVRGLSSGSRPTVDVLVVLDGSDAAASDTAVSLAMDRPDLTFAVIHLEDPTRGRPHQAEPIDRVLRAARARTLSMLGFGEEVVAQVALVLTPGTLELPANPLMSVTSGRLAVVAVPPSLDGGVMDFVAAREHAEAIFGLAPVWCALEEASQEVWCDAGWRLPTLATQLPRPRPEVDLT